MGLGVCKICSRQQSWHSLVKQTQQQQQNYSHGALHKRTATSTSAGMGSVNIQVVFENTSRVEKICVFLQSYKPHADHGLSGENVPVIFTSQTMYVGQYIPDFAWWHHRRLIHWRQHPYPPVCPGFRHHCQNWLLSNHHQRPGGTVVNLIDVVDECIYCSTAVPEGGSVKRNRQIWRQKWTIIPTS